MPGEDFKQILSDFTKTLNSHGYGFHYSILKLAYQLEKQGRSSWLFEAAEFPVEVQGKGTRIDFILRHRTSPELYLLAECKRANPALANWCFVPAPFVHRRRLYEPTILECVETGPSDDLQTYPMWASRASGMWSHYHIALPIRTKIRGDEQGQGKETIEEAATQILRGLNGMVEFFSHNRQALGNRRRAILLPTIFTTARIWAAEINLCASDVADGTIEVQEQDFTQRKWLALQYHQSPGLKHSVTVNERSEELGEILDSEYVRTIFVVGADGIEPFLSAVSQLDFTEQKPSAAQHGIGVNPRRARRPSRSGAV